MKKQKTMKHMIKNLIATGMATTLAFAMAGCGSSSSTSSSSTPAADAPAVEESAATSQATEPSGGTLKMATNAEFPPYEFYDGQEIVGIDVEIAGAIAEKLGMELVVENMEFGSIIAAVTSGKVDIGMAGMTVTEDRLENVDFSVSYATAIQVVIVPEDSAITDVDDLFLDGADNKVGVQTGTTGDIYATGDIEDGGFGTIERFTKGADAVQALLTGRLDCVMIDNEPAKEFVAANEGLKILDSEYALENYAIAVDKGSELTAKIDAALGSLIADGTVEHIINKYIPVGEDAATETAEAVEVTTAVDGILTMGTNAEFPPYEYYEGQEIVGIDVEIAEAIATKLGLELEIENMDFGSVIAAVTTGKVDIGMSGITVTEDRKQNVDFTTPYTTAIQVIIVAEDSEITTIDDLFTDGADNSVGVQTGTTGDIYATGDIEDGGFGSIERFSKGADAVQALVSGRLDCVMIDNEPAKEFVAANTGLKILESEYALEDYAIAVDKDSELTAHIDAALNELIADGTVDAIIAKYIPAE
ncbi:MAG: transporter substrate-binding domain-containing protein [Bacillota bacterium]